MSRIAKRGKKEQEETSEFCTSSQQITSADAAMDNYLIATQILSKCSFEALKTFRLVSKRWKRGVNAEILRRGRQNGERRDAPLEFFWDDAAQTYKLLRSYKPRIGYNDSNGSEGCLCELAGVLKWATDFPYYHFSFSGGDLESGGASEFFENYGKSLQTLVLKGVQPRGICLVRLLITHVPNIQKLSISFKPENCRSWMSLAPSSSHSRGIGPIGPILKLNPETLNSLEYLHFGNEMNDRDCLSSIALEIVKCAKNLKIVSNFPIRDFSPDFWSSPIIKPPGKNQDENGEGMKRIELLKQVIITKPNYYRQLSTDIQNLARAKPNLKILNVSAIFDSDRERPQTLSKLEKSERLQIKSALQLIFQSSANSLEIFHGGCWSSIPAQITFSNVHRVSLKLDMEETNGKFNARVFQTAFPRVSSLALEFLPHQRQPLVSPEWHNYFEVTATNSSASASSSSCSLFSSGGKLQSQSQIISVGELKLSGGVPKDSWEHFHNLFPNLQRLESHLAGRSYQDLFGLWPHLGLVDWVTWHDNSEDNEDQIINLLNPWHRVTIANVTTVTTTFKTKYYWRVQRGDCPQVIWASKYPIDDTGNKTHAWTDIEAFAL